LLLLIIKLSVTELSHSQEIAELIACIFIHRLEKEKQVLPFFFNFSMVSQREMSLLNGTT